MRKIAIILLLIFISYCNSFTQDKTYSSKKIELSKWHIGINAGPGFPSGDFASKDATMDKSGFAKFGYKVEVNGGYNFTKIIGIGIMAFLNSNGIDLEPLNNKLVSLYPGTSWTYEPKRWAVYGAMAGLTIKYPASKKLYFETKILTGILKQNTPEFLFKENYNTYRISEKSSSSFTYLVYLGAIYPIEKSLYLTIGAEYIGSNPFFENIQIENLRNNVTTVTSSSYTQKMQMFNFTIGFKHTF